MMKKKIDCVTVIMGLNALLMVTIDWLNMVKGDEATDRHLIHALCIVICVMYGFYLGKATVRSRYRRKWEEDYDKDYDKDKESERLDR